MEENLFLRIISIRKIHNLVFGKFEEKKIDISQKKKALIIIHSQ